MRGCKFCHEPVCCCEKKKPCGECPDKKLDAKCVTYTNLPLLPLGIIRGDNLEEVILRINEMFSDVYLKVTDSEVKIINVGTGAPIYKGKDDVGREEFKTLSQGIGILLTPENDTIRVSVNEEWVKNYLKKSADADWFGDLVKRLIKQDWFKQYLASIMDEPWFEQVLKGNLEKQWFKDLINSFLQNLNLNIQTSGEGEALFKKNGGNYTFKGLSSSDGSVTLEVTDGKIDFKVARVPQTPPVKKEVVATATGDVSLVHSDTETKAEISRLKSSSLKLTKNNDGSVSIEQPSEAGIKTFYVNNTYQPTADFPSNGSISRPYLTFDEARAAVVGSGTDFNPENKYARIIVQTSGTVAENPTVNTLTIELQNDVSLTYTGFDAFVFDSEKIYNSVGKNGSGGLQDEMFMKLVGNGIVTNFKGPGILRWDGSQRAGVTTDKYSYFYIGEKTSDRIQFLESDTYSWEGNQTKAGGESYGSDFKYSKSLMMTNPIVRCNYKNPSADASITVQAGELFIESLLNYNLRVDEEGRFSSAPNARLNVSLNAKRIPVDLIDERVTGKPEIYKPMGNTAFFYIAGVFNVYNLVVPNYGTHSHVGRDAFFILAANASLLYTSLKYSSNYHFNYFINDAGATEGTFILNGIGGNNTGYVEGSFEYMVMTSKSDYRLVIPNFKFKSVENLVPAATNLVLDTEGSFSVINDNLINSGVKTFANDAAAKSAGLVRNMLYRDTASGQIKQIL